MTPARRHTATGQGIKRDDDIPTRRLAYVPSAGKHQEVVSAAPFIKGPIPRDWITTANALPGKAGAVGIALWFLSGVKGSATFKVTAEARQVAACSRQAFSRGLDALEDAGLVAVQRRSGNNPEVTIQKLRV